ncbi:DUF6384 family protein [Roseibium suaedae]|uniref:Uncharacterized protein n=1 Tax=Roseibium suaedae TaxID=735517 RepID=A0A1M7GE40_9HYPH|nr:DUF6384 family protein [Roseibium suaedae]SHM14491.1 hypothetical protein SAMN05444272_1896 [Roseibium suaedae]
MADRADAPLDDLMMAMDVVDTLRHDEALIMKELATDDRDDRMIERLRQVYASQGIDVPDDILKAGVEGLKEDRFVYSPPASGFQRWLALLYVTRMRWSKWAAGLALALILCLAGWQFLVVMPRERAAAALQVELSETIPQSIASLRSRIEGLTSDADILASAKRLEEDGLAAAAAGNAEAARKSASSLNSMAAELALTFEVKIVSRPGVPTGVTRIPEANQRASNYYIVVEAIGPDGKALSRTITSEEDGKSHEVSIWAQRVSSSLFNRVRDDKSGDGIVQDTLLGTKERGKLAVTWKSGVQTGAITEW